MSDKTTKQTSRLILARAPFILVMLWLGLAILLLTACQTPEPDERSSLGTITVTTPPDLPQDEQSPLPQNPGLEILLNYLPAEWAESHQAVAWGPAIHFIDVAQIRSDLALDNFTGADDFAAKRDLLLNVHNQGLVYVPEKFSIVGPSAFTNWGFDVADVTQAIYIPDIDTAILMGDFSRDEIQTALQADEAGMPYEDFVLYEILAKGLTLAWKADTLIICGLTDDPQAVVKGLIDNKTKPGLGTHPIVQTLLPHLVGNWGGVLAPAPDVVTFSQQAADTLPDTFREQMEERFGELGSMHPLPWEFMVIGHRGEGDLTKLVVVYYYPTAEDAAANQNAVQMRLTETPSLQSPGLSWSDLITLDEEVTTEANLVLAHAHTEVPGFIGNAFARRDFTGFMAFPVVDLPLNE